MAELKIVKENRIDYDEMYSISISTSKVLTADEYKVIMSSIETISKVFDIYLQIRRDHINLKKQQNGK